jgi:hypothetical protein
MRNLHIKLLFAALLLRGTCAAAQAFELRSADIRDNGTLKPDQVYQGSGCNGGNRSPQLEWSGAPADTKSFAVTIFDPDAPTGNGWWHWLVYDIPASVHRLDAGASKSLPQGAKQGRNDFGAMDFDGACPPVGDKPHRYIVTLYALNVPKLGVPADAAPARIDATLRAHRIGSASLSAKYGR